MGHCLAGTGGRESYIFMRSFALILVNDSVSSIRYKRFKSTTITPRSCLIARDISGEVTRQRYAVFRSFRFTGEVVREVPSYSQASLFTTWMDEKLMFFLQNYEMRSFVAKEGFQASAIERTTNSSTSNEKCSLLWRSTPQLPTLKQRPIPTPPRIVPRAYANISTHNNPATPTITHAAAPRIPAPTVAAAGAAA